MKLNLTLLTVDRIYQSPDCRIVDPPRGTVISDQSSKTVHLSYSTFYGVLTYTGVGKWQQRSTADHVVDWLSEIGDVPLTQVADMVARRGSAFIDQIRRQNRKHYQ